MRIRLNISLRSIGSMRNNAAMKLNVHSVNRVTNFGIHTITSPERKKESNLCLALSVRRSVLLRAFFWNFIVLLMSCSTLGMFIVRRASIAPPLQRNIRQIMKDNYMLKRKWFQKQRLACSNRKHLFTVFRVEWIISQHRWSRSWQRISFDLK